MKKKILIVGSGLASISACKALIKRGFKPIIYDIGNDLDLSREKIKKKLSNQNHQDWNINDINFITKNNTILKNPIPKKLAFGSNYLYGSKNSNSIIKNIDPPPFSNAKGGFSVAWGASVLPPDNCDIKDWPLNHVELNKYYKEILKDIPYSGLDDMLSMKFPIIKKPDGNVSLSDGNKKIIESLNNSYLKNSDDFLYGQSRLLLNVLNNKNSCKYCGACMSGCVYDSIYKANLDLEKLIKMNKINYYSNKEVLSFEESHNHVVVEYLEENKIKKEKFDKLFVGAGVFNSTKILLKSKKIIDQKAYIKTTHSIILPILSAKGTELNWPNINTMPGIFLEFKNTLVSNNWIHVQLSTPNEMVLEKFRFKESKKKLFLSSIKKFLINRTYIAHINMHSDLSGHYEISYKIDKNHKHIFVTKKINNSNSRTVTKLSLKKLSEILKVIKLYPLNFLSKTSDNFESFHLGSSIPMKIKTKNLLETDLLGRPHQTKNVHIIDSSILPSLPATTIGLVTMANAYRIGFEAKI